MLSVSPMPVVQQNNQSFEDLYDIGRAMDDTFFPGSAASLSEIRASLEGCDLAEQLQSLLDAQSPLSDQFPAHNSPSNTIDLLNMALHPSNQLPTTTAAMMTAPFDTCSKGPDFLSSPELMGQMTLPDSSEFCHARTGPRGSFESTSSNSSLAAHFTPTPPGAHYPHQQTMVTTSSSSHISTAGCTGGVSGAATGFDGHHLMASHHPTTSMGSTMTMSQHSRPLPFTHHHHHQVQEHLQPQQSYTAAAVAAATAAAAAATAAAAGMKREQFSAQRPASDVSTTSSGSVMSSSITGTASVTSSATSFTTGSACSTPATMFQCEPGSPSDCLSDTSESGAHAASGGVVIPDNDIFHPRVLDRNESAQIRKLRSAKREVRRLRLQKEAFQRLSQLLPGDTRRTSRLELLRRTTEYIGELQAALQEQKRRSD